MAFDQEEFNVCIAQGDTWVLELQLFEADGTTPINITGRVARVQVRETPAAVAVLLDLTDGSGLTVTPLDGKIAINASTTPITILGDFVWACELGGAEVEEIANGQFKVLQDIVR